MDNLKYSLYDISGGVFIGKLVDYIVPKSSDNLSSSTAPKILLELAIHTIGISVLTTQYFKWRGSGSADNLKSLMFLVGLFISSTGFANRIRQFANWVQSWSLGELQSIGQNFAKNTGITTDPYATSTITGGDQDVPPKDTSVEQSYKNGDNAD